MSFCCCKSVDVLTRSSTATQVDTPVTPVSLIRDWYLQSEDVQENVAFVDNSEGDIVDLSTTINPIASRNATSNTDLARFLSRPTLIRTTTWNTGTLTGAIAVQEPWYDFLNNGVIKNKLSNYAFIRGTLCLKFVINATPFHFGLMRIAYEPSVNIANTGYRPSALRYTTFPTQGQIIGYSQLPGIWVHPADNSAGTLRLPFFRHTNWLPLEFGADAKSMGTLTYFNAYPLTLASTNGNVGVTLDTYAWMEDVELSGTTSTLILQSQDEYDGPISSVASAAASVSRRLEDVPIIGRFAKATTIGARAIASIAHIFGYTNVPVIKDIKALQPAIGPQLASAEIGSQLSKLTLDPKAELSIDPSIHGVGSEDELNIHHIVSKPTTLCIPGWATSDLPSTVLFYTRVNPALFGSQTIIGTGGSSYQVQHTFLSYVSTMFTHWHGDIIFDIEVICTKFHKGRLRLTWDPLYSGSSVPAENTVYTTILDIGESTHSTITVPYHAALAWLRTRGISQSSWSVGSAGTPSADRSYDNGAFMVSVLTPLSSPVAPQSIGVKITVRAGASFEVTNPKNFLGESESIPPSFYDVQGKDEVDLKPQEVTLGDTFDPHPERYMLNFGERVVSLRQVLHRMSLYENSCLNLTAGSAYLIARYQKSVVRKPLSYGFSPGGTCTANKLVGAGTTPFNYLPMHPITYISMLYGGSRGSVHFLANFGNGYTSMSDIRVSRDTMSNQSLYRRGLTNGLISLADSISSKQRTLNECNAGAAGAAITSTDVNSGISWVYPMMTNYNFEYTIPNGTVAGNPNDGSDKECCMLEAYVKAQSASSILPSITCSIYCGTGVDYTTIWLLCCPTLDYYTVNPTPA